jgi:hypothetical protein
MGDDSGKGNACVLKTRGGTRGGWVVLKIACCCCCCCCCWLGEVTLSNLASVVVMFMSFVSIDSGEVRGDASELDDDIERCVGDCGTGTERRLAVGVKARGTGSSLSAIVPGFTRVVACGSCANLSRDSAQRMARGQTSLHSIRIAVVRLSM